MSCDASPRTAASAPSAALIAASAGALSALPHAETSSATISTPTELVHRFTLARRMASSSRDAQPLPDLDEIGIFDRVLVGLEDLRVEAAVAVVLRGDLPQGLAFLHLMPLRGIPARSSASLFHLVRHGAPPHATGKIVRPLEAYELKRTRGPACGLVRPWPYAAAARASGTVASPASGEPRMMSAWTTKPSALTTIAHSRPHVTPMAPPSAAPIGRAPVEPVMMSADTRPRSPSGVTDWRSVI